MSCLSSIIQYCRVWLQKMYAHIWWLNYGIWLDRSLLWYALYIFNWLPQWFYFLFAPLLQVWPCCPGYWYRIFIHWKACWALIGKKMMYTVKFNLVSLEAVNPCQHPISVFSLAVNPSSRLIWIGTRVYCQWKERNRLLKWDFFLFTGSKPLPAANFFLLTWGNFSVFTVVLIGSKLVMVKTSKTWRPEMVYFVDNTGEIYRIRWVKWTYF